VKTTERIFDSPCGTPLFTVFKICHYLCHSWICQDCLFDCKPSLFSTHNE